MAEIQSCREMLVAERSRTIVDFVTVCGARMAGAFEERLATELLEQLAKVESPIEQVLYCALRTFQHEWPIPDCEPLEFVDGEMTWTWGITISPQYQIGKYRVDFLISCEGGRREKACQIIVECDSQEWHERNPKQRQYEKARDRFLLSKGYKVFHYTGQEILSRPFEIAEELLGEIKAL